MENKDFLSQFSTNNKPDSYKEEERIKVDKPKKEINPKTIIIGVIALIVIAAIIFVIFFMPKIKVEDFTGRQKEDAVAWIRQQEIETTGIIFREEYDFDNASGTVLAQDPNEGKVTKSAKMTFVISKGPDPDERITVPDFESMDKEQINYWIKTNKLLSTKINTTYSDEVEQDQFIKAEYTGCEADSFTRGCSLKISISKGAKPEDEITMADFVKKSYAEIEAWATPKKIKLNKSEAYSDTIDTGLIISQSVKENEKVKAGDTVNVVVSKGKAVYAKNFIGEDIEDVTYWATKNNVYLISKEQYSSDYSKGEVISQSIAAGKIITDEFVIYVSLGNPEFNITGKSYQDLKDWMNEVNQKGADLSKGTKSYENSDTIPVNGLIRIGSTNVGSNLNPVISIGKNILLKNTSELIWTNAVPEKYSEEQMRTLCSANEGVSCIFKYEKSSELDVSQVIKIERSDGEDVTANSYISQNVDIVITICDEKIVLGSE